MHSRVWQGEAAMYGGLEKPAASHQGFPVLTDGSELLHRKKQKGEVEELEAGGHWHTPSTILISVSWFSINQRGTRIYHMPKKVCWHGIIVTIVCLFVSSPVLEDSAEQQKTCGPMFRLGVRWTVRCQRTTWELYNADCCTAKQLALGDVPLHCAVSPVLSSTPYH